MSSTATIAGKNRPTIVSGSASLATDASGATLANSATRYYPFGETRTGSMPTDHQYTGQRFEAGFGLYDYGARWYDPVLGRFVQADTIVPSPGKPQDFNRYSYVLNNPLKYTDPTGHAYCGDQYDPYCMETTDEWIAYDSREMHFLDDVPTSYVRIFIKYSGTGWERGRGSAGVGVDTNAILSHNHQVGSWGDASSIEGVKIINHNGDVFTFGQGEFVFDEVIDSGLSIFVFNDDVMTASDAALLGDADALKAGDSVQQYVYVGASPGLYSTNVIGFDEIKNTRYIDYTVLNVAPDKTDFNDSGNPLYVDNRVYGVNNSGNEVANYGPILEIKKLRNKIQAMSK